MECAIAFSHSCRQPSTASSRRVATSLALSASKGGPGKPVQREVSFPKAPDVSSSTAGGNGGVELKRENV